MSDIVNLSIGRRGLLGAAAGGALLLGFRIPVAPRAAQAASDSAALNAFVAVNEDGRVTVQCPYIEMGQGTYTGIPSLVAEELEIALDQVDVEQAPPGPEYRLIRDTRFTGGSNSIRSSWEPLRRAGAMAREMLVGAAAQRFGVDRSELVAEDGHVRHPASGRSAAYGELVAAAAEQTPGAVTLKEPGQFRLLGNSPQRLDIPAKTDGTATFGVDTRVEGMLFAAVRQSPVFGGEPARFDADAAMAKPGVVAVEGITGAVAVVARSWWHAERGLEALNVEFGNGPAPDFDSDAHEKKLRDALSDKGVPGEQHGQAVDGLLGDPAGRVTADYFAPFLAHATLEPQNCTALVTDEACTLWAPNQGVDRVVQVAAQLTGLPETAITVHTPFLGGGFGRRFMPDFTIQVLELAVRHKGRPIKLVWSREQDMQHDFYRPAIAARYTARLGEDGLPVAMRATIAGDGPYKRHFGAVVDEIGFDPSVLEGATHASYGIDNRSIDYVYVETPPPIGFWRSVGNSHNGFVKESFVDELAAAAGEDPYRYRRRLLAGTPRVLAVLDAAAELAAWRSQPWKVGGVERAQGIALHEAYDSIVAQVAEVSIEGGRPRVHAVYCAVDCGIALNPNIVTMQVESGLAYGLSAALHEKVSMQSGRTRNGNFDDYPILRASEMPSVSVRIIDSGEKVGGIGEVGTPPIAPAVCGALYALTGKRVRSLPIGSIEA